MMAGKKDKKFLFEINLNWISSKKGLLSANDAEGTLHVATPPVFGGEGKPWTPEHLFLGSISSCFMTTFLAMAQKLKFTISGFDCSIRGQISFSEGRYRFSAIDLYPKIFVANESLRVKAALALEKTQQYYIITNSVNAPVLYHREILVDEHSTVGHT
jgi:organic hydroperoxide reductase OsmC/OhrA